MHILKRQLYLLEQHSDSFEIWSAIILDLQFVIKLGPGLIYTNLRE